MKVEFTKFQNGDNWVKGMVNNGEYSFESMLFDGGSTYGINEGRVSTLSISYGHTWAIHVNRFVNYDRGWYIEPETEEEKQVFAEVLEFLENAPTTRFHLHD